MFSGLDKFAEIDLRNNKIFQIGTKDFENLSDLRSLQKVDLSLNNLTVLQPWPFIIARVLADRKSKFTALLRRNAFMSNFVNTIGVDVNNVRESSCEVLDLKWTYQTVCLSIRWTSSKDGDLNLLLIVPTY